MRHLHRHHDNYIICLLTYNRVQTIVKKNTIQNKPKKKSTFLDSSPIYINWLLLLVGFTGFARPQAMLLVETRAGFTTKGKKM